MPTNYPGVFPVIIPFRCRWCSYNHDKVCPYTELKFAPVGPIVSERKRQRTIFQGCEELGNASDCILQCSAKGGKLTGEFSLKWCRPMARKMGSWFGHFDSNSKQRNPCRIQEH